MTQIELHHEHHKRPLQAHPDVVQLHAAVTEKRHPHGPEAHLICDCFRAMTDVSVEEAHGIEGDSERIEVLKKLWLSMVTARQMPEA